MLERAAPFNFKEAYRLPWSLTDNGISWLEVTASCNLACEGCYRPKTDGHKSIDQIKQELEVFARERKSDCMSIAGGDPLVHPKILEIIKLVKEGGWKPIINTNGLALAQKPELLKQVKEAGAFGFTFHIDTSQERFDSPYKTETEHNALREKLANLVAEEGGLVCGFNQTVTSATLHEIPEVVRWARKHPDKVNTIVFILYREPGLIGQQFEYFARGKKIPLADTYEKASDWQGNRVLKCGDVIEKIREVEPDYAVSAYLNGTEDAQSSKWTLASRIAIGEETLGWVSGRFMEMVQEGSHLARGKWLAYSSPDFLATGKSSAFAFAPFCGKMRKIAKNYMKYIAKNPHKAHKAAHIQTFTIIQPVDMLADGRMNMCDGCPDMTVYNGKLYWSCRLEEIKQYGAFVTAVPVSKKPSVEKEKVREKEEVSS